MHLCRFISIRNARQIKNVLTNERRFHSVPLFRCYPGRHVVSSLTLSFIMSTLEALANWTKASAEENFSSLFYSTQWVQCVCSACPLNRVMSTASISFPVASKSVIPWRCYQSLYKFYCPFVLSSYRSASLWLTCLTMEMTAWACTPLSL